MPPIIHDILEILLPIALAVLATATLLQLLFHWGILARFAFSKTDLPITDLATFQKLSNLAPAHSPLSVIICARNEAENLLRHLPAVLEQEFPGGEFEVIVVDDASTDATAEVLANFQKNYAQLRVVQRVEKKRSGKKDALTAGIAAARFEKILLTDADCWPASRLWLAKMSAILEQPGIEIVLGYGPYWAAPPTPTGGENEGEKKTRNSLFSDLPPLWGSGGLLNRWIRFEAAWSAVQYFAFALAGRPYMGVGRNLAWKKHLFAAVGGFSAHTQVASGDDDLFVNAAAKPNNTAVCSDPDTFVFSEGKKTWAAYFRQKARHFSVGRLYRPSHQAYLALGSISHTLCYFSMLFLLIFRFGMVFVAALYVIRFISVILVLAPSLRKLREHRLLFWIPFFDAALAVFYVVFAPIILLSDKSHRRPWT